MFLCLFFPEAVVRSLLLLLQPPESFHTSEDGPEALLEFGASYEGMKFVRFCLDLRATQSDWSPCPGSQRSSPRRSRRPSPVPSHPRRKRSRSSNSSARGCSRVFSLSDVDYVQIGRASEGRGLFSKSITDHVWIRARGQQPAGRAKVAIPPMWPGVGSSQREHTKCRT